MYTTSNAAIAKRNVTTSTAKMPPMPIFEVEYEGLVYPPEQIRGSIQVWWRLTDDLGIVLIRF